MIAYSLANCLMIMYYIMEISELKTENYENIKNYLVIQNSDVFHEKNVHFTLNSGCHHIKIILNFHNHHHTLSLSEQIEIVGQDEDQTYSSLDNNEARDLINVKSEDQFFKK